MSCYSCLVLYLHDGKKNTFHIIQFQKVAKRHQRICFKQIKYVLNKKSQLLLNEVYIYIIFPMLA